MEKKIIKILTVSQKTESFSLLALQDEAIEKRYDLIVFLPNKEKNCLEIILLNHMRIPHRYFEETFQITIRRDGEGYFNNFKINEIEELEFYQILKKEFQIEIRSLSQI